MHERRRLFLVPISFGRGEKGCIANLCPLCQVNTIMSDDDDEDVEEIKAETEDVEKELADTVLFSDVRACRCSLFSVMYRSEFF